MGVLSGVKVLDLTRLLLGPYYTLLMADYGAGEWGLHSLANARNRKDRHSALNGEPQ